MASKMMCLVFIGLLAHMASGQSFGQIVEDVKALRSAVGTLLQRASYVSTFSYTNNGIMKLSSGRNLVLPNMVSKIGEGYNPSNGVYTAPRRGLYLFNLHVASNQKDTSFTMQLLANNRVVGRLWVMDKDNDVQSAISEVVHLEQGQTVRVYIERASGSREMDNRLYSVFSGVLLQQTARP